MRSERPFDSFNMEENLAAEFRDLRDRCDYLLTYEQQVFYQLAQLLRPEWSESDVFEITTKLVHAVNLLLIGGSSSSSGASGGVLSSLDQLRNASHAPENKPISLFLNLRSLKELLAGISCGLLCNLASTVPMGDPAQRHAFLLSVQERFQLWSNAQLESLKTDFDKLPIYHQHAYMMQSLQDSQTPPQVRNALSSLLSFSLQDVLAFKAWIESLDGASINVIANLFQFTEDFIVKVWSLLCAPLPALGYGLTTSQDGWGMLGTSFNNPFPHMNASDDGSIGDWNRNKKRTAGGTSKHIINLNDSSSGSVALRLSSSLNIFAPQTKRSIFSSMSPSSNNMLHELAMPPPIMPGSAAAHHHVHQMLMDAMSGGGMNPSSASSASAASASVANPVSSTSPSSSSAASSSSFHHMLHASEPPLLSDGLRSSNWAVLPPKFYTETEDAAGSVGSSKDGGAASSILHHLPPSHPHHIHPPTPQHLQQHPLASHYDMPTPPLLHSSGSPHSHHLHQQHHLHHHMAGEELRTANSDISGLAISQELSVVRSTSPNGTTTMMSPHNAAFFPAASFAPQVPPTFGHSPSSMNSSLGTPTSYDGIPVGNPMLHVTSHKMSTQSNNVGYLNGVRLELRIIGAPPAKSVYQRILKPYPVVKVIGADKLVNRVLFLKASLWNADGTAQMSCLDGGLQVAAQPTTATFKKLKVLNTSVQKGTLFKLKFQLEVFGEREQALDIHVWSDPMEVVSHTVYLTNPSNSAPTPATVTEAIPNCGLVGSRVIILGSSFIDVDTVRVKFGESIAHHTFHESGALIAHVPPQPPGAGNRVLVSVSNDGTDYSATNAAFTYL